MTLGELIIKVLRDEGKPMTSVEIAEKLGVSNRTVAQAVGHLRRKGRIKGGRNEVVKTPYGEFKRQVRWESLWKLPEWDLDIPRGNAK